MRFLVIRSAGIGFRSPFGLVLINFSLLNTIKRVLQSPKIRFCKFYWSAKSFLTISRSKKYASFCIADVASYFYLDGRNQRIPVFFV